LDDSPRPLRRDEAKQDIRFDGSIAGVPVFPAGLLVDAAPAKPLLPGLAAALADEANLRVEVRAAYADHRRRAPPRGRPPQFSDVWDRGIEVTRQNVPPKLLSQDKKAMPGDFKRLVQFSIDGEHRVPILHRSVFRYNGGRMTFGENLAGFRTFLGSRRLTFPLLGVPGFVCLSDFIRVIAYEEFGYTNSPVRNPASTSDRSLYENIPISYGTFDSGIARDFTPDWGDRVRRIKQRVEPGTDVEALICSMDSERMEYVRLHYKRNRLDHGTWAVFRHFYHDAAVPIVQLSIDQTQPAAFHFELGNRLAALRDDGILIAGSGNHNLRKYAWGQRMPDPYDWAVRFERNAKELMLAGDYKALINYESLGHNALLSVPTPDHYLPLLYVLATRQEGDDLSFPVEGIEGGSLSMLTARIG